MADSNSLAVLLNRASNVFSLAGTLGRAFDEEHQGLRQGLLIDPARWNRHAPTFKEFCDALLVLREPMLHPPDGFGPVAEQLLKAACIAKGIRDTIQRYGGRPFGEYLDFFLDLYSVCENGWQAVKKVTKARRLDDPFAFVEAPAAATNAAKGQCEPAESASGDRKPEAEKGTRSKGLTANEMNVRASDYLKKHATDDHVVTVRELADYLKSVNPAGTCSVRTVTNLPAYRAYRDELERRGLVGRKHKPKAVTLSDVEHALGERDLELDKLMEEHCRDYEPSPLDPDPTDRPRRVRVKKQV